MNTERQHPEHGTLALKKLSLIVAASENNVIGNAGDLPWRLSADLKRFKRLTMGHPIIMGRKTFESIGRLLPGRTTVIVTRQPDFQFEGAIVVGSVEAAIDAVESAERAFVTGGAEIYALLLPRVSEIQLTRVHAEISGDTVLPPIDWSRWELVGTERHAADAKNNYDYSFETYHRRES